MHKNLMHIAVNMLYNFLMLNSHFSQFPFLEASVRGWLYFNLGESNASISVHLLLDSVDWYLLSLHHSKMLCVVILFYVSRHLLPV